MDNLIIQQTELSPITEKELDAFRKATLTETAGIPLTFATRFRQLEFQLLKELKIDLKGLLHTDQAYRYLGEFRLGDPLEIQTEITENKMKRGLQFLKIKTTVSSRKELKVISESQMVIRLDGSDEKKNGG